MKQVSKSELINTLSPEARSFIRVFDKACGVIEVRVGGVKWVRQSKRG